MISISNFIDEYNRVKQNIADAYDAVAAKEGIIPEVKNSNNLPAAIESIESGGKINIFAQSDEPETKDGIWIKTERQVKNMFSFDSAEPLLNLPFYNNVASDAIGELNNLIYFFNQLETSSSEKHLYIYNTLTNEGYFTDILIPNNSSYVINVCRAENIFYLFYNDKSLYSYDTINNNFTLINTFPSEDIYKTVFLDNNIYIFRSGHLYKYNILDNTYTFMTTYANISNKYCGIVLIDKKIYITGTSDYSTSSFIYDIEQNIITYLDSRLQWGPGNILYFNGSIYYIYYPNFSSTDVYKEYIIKEDKVITYNRTEFLKGGNLYYTYPCYFATIQKTKDIYDIYYIGNFNTSDRNIRKFTFYYQEICPEIKKFELDNIIITDDISPYQRLTDIPYNFYNSSVVTVDNDIYLLGCQEYKTYNYKYNILTDSYTKLTNIPYDFYNAAATTVDTDIYLFGSTNSNYYKYAYKYNTLTNSYTKLTNIPINFYCGSAITVGTDIYLFMNTNAYKYNTLTNSYTKLTNIPYNFYRGSATVINTDIYLFGSSSSSYQKYAYKYDTLTNSYTKLANIPYEFYYGSIGVINSDIYLFSSSVSGYERYVYKYYTQTNSYERLEDIPYNFHYGAAVTNNNEIFLFGSYDSNYRKYAYKYLQPELSTDIIIITKNKVYSIILTKGFILHFTNANIFIEGKKYLYPVYYGDGEKWNLIETEE